MADAMVMVPNRLMLCTNLYLYIFHLIWHTINKKIFFFKILLRFKLRKYSMTLSPCLIIFASNHMMSMFNLLIFIILGLSKNRNGHFLDILKK